MHSRARPRPPSSRRTHVSKTVEARGRDHGYLRMESEEGEEEEELGGGKRNVLSRQKLLSRGRGGGDLFRGLLKWCRPPALMAHHKAGFA